MFFSNQETIPCGKMKKNPRNGRISRALGILLSGTLLAGGLGCSPEPQDGPSVPAAEGEEIAEGGESSTSPGTEKSEKNDREREGKDPDRSRNERGNNGSGGNGRGANGPSGRDGSRSGDHSNPPGDRDGNDRDRSGRNGPPGPRGNTSSAKDPPNDAENHGDTPDYIDITRATVSDRGGEAVFTATFAGDVPQAMPDNDTFSYVGFTLKRRGEDRSVSASCSDEGWQPAAGGGGSFSGDFSLRGNSIVWVVPWSAVGGRGRFTWFVDSSWTQSGTLDTYWAFDSAPDGQDARFP